MKSQKEISFEVVSLLRLEGKPDSLIMIEGSILLLESFKRGEWSKSKGLLDDSTVLGYSKELLKNWMKKDTRLNGGAKYIPLNPRKIA